MGKSSEKRALLDMGEAALNARRWTQAGELYERVLELDPGSSRGYMGRLLAKLQFRSEEEMARLFREFPEEEDFNMALLYADGERRGELMELCRRSLAENGQPGPSLDEILADGDFRTAAAEEPQPPEADTDTAEDESLCSAPVLSGQTDEAEPEPETAAAPAVPPDAFPGIPAPTGAPAARPAVPAVSRSAVRMLESRIRSQTEVVNGTLDDILSERSFGLSTFPLCVTAAGIVWGALWYYNTAEQLAVMITAAVLVFALLVNLIVSLIVSRQRMRRMAEEEFAPEMDKLEALYEELYSARTGRPLNYASTLLELRLAVQKGRYGRCLPSQVLYKDEVY